MGRQLRYLWRRDRIPLFLYLLTFIVMTYPFVLRMGDSLPLYNADTFEILSKNWSLREALIHGKDLDHSELLFHPNGLDITLQPQRLTTFPLWTLLYTLFGDPLAYNLVSLFGILFKAYGMYLLGIYLFRARIPAWVCGAFYSFAALILTLALRNPDTGATEWIPWFILALVYGLDRLRARNGLRRTSVIMVIASLCFALNAYMHLRIAIFAMLLGGGCIVWSMFADRLWARRRFWAAMLVFALTATTASAPLLIRVLRSDQFGHAISRGVWVGAGGGSDLLSFFKADLEKPAEYKQLIASLGDDQLEANCLCNAMSHVGMVALVFATMGAIYLLRFQRSQAIWIVLAVLSFLLSLGVVVYVDGKPLDVYWTPYRLLQDNFFFRSLYVPFRMTVVFLFPFSILIGYGLHSRLRTVTLDRNGSLMLIVSVIALLYGTSIFPIAMAVSPRPAYLSALEKLPAGAVIDLPFGRKTSMYFMAMQRFHRRPIAEGRIPRTPPEAFDYIENNAVLRTLAAMSKGEEFERPGAAEWHAALADLLNVGFRYLVLHREVPVEFTQLLSHSELVEASIHFPPPSYQDKNTTIYELSMSPGPYFLGLVDGYADLPEAGEIGISVGDNFTLHRWSLLDSVEVAPCQTVRVESWWDIAEPNETPHTLSLILAEEDGDGQVAITNVVPADKFTNEWQTGIFYREQTELTIPCGTPSGNYPLLLAMKESMNGKTLVLHYPDGSPIGTLYYLTTLRVAQD